MKVVMHLCNNFTLQYIRLCIMDLCYANYIGIAWLNVLIALIVLIVLAFSFHTSYWVAH